MINNLKHNLRTKTNTKQIESQNQNYNLIVEKILRLKVPVESE